MGISGATQIRAKRVLRPSEGVILQARKHLSTSRGESEIKMISALLAVRTPLSPFGGFVGTSLCDFISSSEQQRPSKQLAERYKLGSAWAHVRNNFHSTANAAYLCCAFPS
jgi:hypothetical protein